MTEMQQPLAVMNALGDTVPGTEGRSEAPETLAAEAERQSQRFPAGTGTGAAISGYWRRCFAEHVGPSAEFL